MTKEVKKETDWLGNTKWVDYEDGQKVGESKKETDWRGQERLVTRDNQGNKVSETRKETDWLGREKSVTYDPSGQKLSETRREENWRGEPRDVIYQEGKKIGELRREEGITDALFDTKRKVLHESPGSDVDLTRRATRGERTEKTTSSGGGNYSPYGSSYRPGSSPSLKKRERVYGRDIVPKYEYSDRGRGCLLVFVLLVILVVVLVKFSPVIKSGVNKIKISEGNPSKITLEPIPPFLLLNGSKIVVGRNQERNCYEVFLLSSKSNKVWPTSNTEAFIAFSEHFQGKELKQKIRELCYFKKAEQSSKK